jgi:hypothetical protein
MEKIPEKKEVSVKLPSSYLKNIYALLLVANNRATWHPDELIPVGTLIKDLKTIIEKCNEEESKDEPKEDEPQEEDENVKEEVKEVQESE